MLLIPAIDPRGLDTRGLGLEGRAKNRTQVIMDFYRLTLGVRLTFV